ncbi:CDF family Co(II)/Ni(II) efflux transporter DmeF [Rhabdaerophilum calidifontis]|uniref:CDF family Co(II)/Ni(II) efflux transporter DmeF n=1 Tax=Rhabdaerophilum calidifontis TaxID=2604328 RepID=UPI00140C0960|nr:CDF family Co(II)/Ni(II) efflux transporter DmeF [Rhabdaerophilum calidifontis]
MSETASPVLEHHFRQHVRRDAERRTLLVVALTGLCMVAEIAAGLWTGSMALLGDGVHMGTHVLAIGISAAAYIVGRRYALDRRFSFGTGKFGALSAFASAILLAAAAVLVAFEAAERVLAPTEIAFREAMLVAVIGLIVNLASALLLHSRHGHAHGHPHAEQGHDHSGSGHHHVHHDCGHHHGGHHHGGHDQHEDVNLRAAFLHVIADAMTSVAAIIALGIGWYQGIGWLDPLVACIASGVILIWSWGLLKESGKILLDWEAPAEIRDAVARALESDGETRVIDLHVWSVGTGVRTMVASVHSPTLRTPEEYRRRLPAHAAIEHPIIEVCPMPAGHP